MGTKGDKQTSAAEHAAKQLLEKLISLDGISSKKMFGGYGIFHDAKMFGMIDPKGQAYLKVDPNQKEILLEKGAQAHAKMPYVTIPEKVLNDRKELESWSSESIKLSKK